MLRGIRQFTSGDTIATGVLNSYKYVKFCVLKSIYESQARRFNDPNSEFRVLVASDAVGMGI
jgi:hypothetical protein